jgi:DNA-binding HxlR family transcriptional regulator
MDSILRLLMGPLTTYIIRVLSDQGPQRFGALKRAVPGISTRMLTERLRMLQSAGVISREQAETIPPCRHRWLVAARRRPAKRSGRTGKYRGTMERRRGL